MAKEDFGRNRFSGRTVIVTGGASGIGRQVCLDFAFQGANVAVTDIDTDGIERVVAEIDAFGGAARGMACDVSRAAEVDRTVAETLDRFGSVDFLINNAGLLLTGTIEETSDEIIDRTLDVNLKGTLYFIRAAAPHMKGRLFGKIVSLSSIAGKNGDNSTVFAYGASKGAVIALTKSVARELGPFNINVNAVAPHAVMTPMMRYWGDAKRERAASQIPLGRLSTPEDVAGVILYLCSDEASFISGETINVNGGFYMD